MKYNYVLLGFGNDYYYQAFADVLELDNVIYISDDIVNKKKRDNLLYRFHVGFINKFIELPFKSFWNSTYFNISFDNENPICFVLWGTWARINKKIGLSDYLRKKYSGCKIVWFLQDLLKYEKDFYSGKVINIEEYRKSYDLIVSYDKADCEKYSLSYHPTVMSYCLTNEDNRMPASDVLFIGRDKGRLQLAVDVCKRFSAMGLKCDFKILGVDKKRQVECEGISYIDSLLPYQEVLAEIKCTKCIVELLQEGADGCTFRTWEALLYDKYLLTNNSGLSNLKYYNKDSMFIISNANDIDYSIVRKIKSNTLLSYNVRDIISPISFINYLDKEL